MSLQHKPIFQNEIKNESDCDGNEINARESESESESDNDSDSDSDSYSEELTDVSEKLEDGDGNGEQVQQSSFDQLHVVPQINIMNATDVSTSDNSSSSSNSKVDPRKPKKKLSEQLHESNSQLQEEIKKCKTLQAHLQDERDAKEDVESDLVELQQKYEHKLKEDEELIHQLQKKDELNSILETKELELIQEVINLKREIAENLDNVHDKSASQDIPSHLHSLNEQLKTELRELQRKLASSEILLAEKSAHVESLEREIVLLKEKISTNQKSVRDERLESERLEVLPSHEIKAKVESMVAEAIDDSHKKIRIKTLEEEVDELKGKLETNEKKYSKDMSEALATLRQVQDAYGEMRDIVLEEYKNEVAHLTDRVRIAEEKSNETIITGLRQELLDSRLQQGRSKQAYKDEKEIQHKALLETQSKQKELSTQVAQLKLDLVAKTEHNKNIQSSLQRNQMIANERKEKIKELSVQVNELNSANESMKGFIVGKDDEIIQLKIKMARSDEIQGKDHAEREALQMEVDIMESVKRQNQRLEDEVEEMSHKVKLRGTKIKFLKKHIKELEKQKQKAEIVMLAIPEMQRKIDELSEEKVKLRQDIINKRCQEEEEKRKVAEEKKTDEIRIQKEKEEWEERILGIGKCLESHGEQNNTSDTLTRPSSAPLLKPRPPTSRRPPSKNNSKSNLASAPTLNPSFLESYPEGIKATQKMKQRKEKALLSQSLTSPCGRFASITKPISYANASYKHIAGGKNFPNISAKSKSDNTFSPSVLVWGDNKGSSNKMLAVGDHVLTNIHSECSSHGHLSRQQPGIVKFIGFVNGNEQDVYVGVRLEEDVGYTDGIIQGKRYFRCEPEKGAFVHLNDIVKVLQTQIKHVPMLAM